VDFRKVGAVFDGKLEWDGTVWKMAEE